MERTNRFKTISDSKNIKLGVLLSYTGMGISILGALFISNKVLNYIGDYNYGLYAFVNSITTWLSVVSSALTASYLRYAFLDANQNNGDVSRTNTVYYKMLSLIGILVLILGFSVLGILYASRSCIGKYNWKDSQLMYGLFALSIVNISITMPTSIFSLYINYKKQFVFARILTIVITIVTFAGQFLIAYFTRSIIAIAAFTILITVATYLCNRVYSKKVIGIRFAKVALRDNRGLFCSIIAFSGILLFNSIVDQINSNVDKTLLGFFARPEDVTIYQMAQQLAMYLTTMSVSVSGVFAPTIHELVVNNDTEKINQLYLKISKIQSMILCCVAFGFMACGKNFIIWWIGEKREISYYVASVLMLLNLGPLTLNSSIEIQRAKNKHLFRAIVYFALAIANIILSVVFLCIFKREYAIFACLAGTVITTIGSHWVSMNVYNKRIIGLPVGKYLLTLLQYIVAGALGYLAILGCNNLFIDQIERTLFKFVAQGVVFVAVYLLLIALINKTLLKNYFVRHKGGNAQR